jgi:hypothetical protein
MKRVLAIAAAAAVTCSIPASAKEWSKDKAWTVTEFNEGACLMRPNTPSGAVFQVIEAVDRRGSLAVSGLPQPEDAEGVLSYGFTDKHYMAVLAARLSTYLTGDHTSIDTMLWKLPARPATLEGKPAFEVEMPRNFLDMFEFYPRMMLSTEDKPQIEGFFDTAGGEQAVAALRKCTAALSEKLAKKAK